MGENSLSAEPRATVGKGPARQMRLQGRIPGVFYFSGDPGVLFSISDVDLKKLLKTRPSLIEFSLKGEDTRECVIREIQRDPVDDSFVHIDLMGVKRGQKLTVTVPVKLVGLPEGVKTGGGILQHVTTDLEIECLPKDIPDAIEVDVEELEIGQARLLSEIENPLWRYLADLSSVIATVQPPTVVVEEVAEEEELEEGEEAEGEGEGEASAEETKSE